MVVNSSNRQRHEWEPLSWGWLRLDGKPSGPLVAQTHRIDTPEAMRGAAPLVDVRLFRVAEELHVIGYDAAQGWMGVLGRLQGGVDAEGSTLLNARLGYAFNDRLSITVDALNMLDSTDRDIQYFYESQLRGEAAPVEDRHFHVFEPRAIRAYLEYTF